ncbi:MAG: Uncharacterised protein [Pseudidiomarina mangrovi]|nr:MAG: Uncharacterised protein [Pseudidiomarina mangrovi]
MSIAKFTDKVQGNMPLQGRKAAFDHSFGKKIPELNKQLGYKGF